jgi:hypothetical protein
MPEWGSDAEGQQVGHLLGRRVQTEEGGSSRLEHLGTFVRALFLAQGDEDGPQGAHDGGQQLPPLLGLALQRCRLGQLHEQHPHAGLRPAHLLDTGAFTCLLHLVCVALPFAERHKYINLI